MDGTTLLGNQQLVKYNINNKNDIIADIEVANTIIQLKKT